MDEASRRDLPKPPGPNRRAVLFVAAVAGGSSVLAACGGGNGDDAGSSGATGKPTGGSSSSAPAGSEPSGPLIATSDVPVGGGVILGDVKVVVTQPAKGEFKAFSAVCTHQQCLVDKVAQGKISCPCHGSSYDAADGSVLGGPAPRALREIPVTVEGDQVVAS